jgi:hypothetical protein
MNFLTDPTTHLAPNGAMTDEQLSIAIEFVEELIKLGVLERNPDDDPIRAICPLFVLAKAGAYVGSDPVVLPSTDYVLRQMDSGGWSAVLDASKFFFQFRTVVTERKSLGLVHLGTGVVYR